MMFLSQQFNETCLKERGVVFLLTNEGWRRDPRVGIEYKCQNNSGQQRAFSGAVNSSRETTSFLSNCPHQGRRIIKRKFSSTRAIVLWRGRCLSLRRVTYSWEAVICHYGDVVKLLSIGSLGVPNTASLLEATVIDASRVSNYETDVWMNSTQLDTNVTAIQCSKSGVRACYKLISERRPRKKFSINYPLPSRESVGTTPAEISTARLPNETR